MISNPVFNKSDHLSISWKTPGQSVAPLAEQGKSEDGQETDWPAAEKNILPIKLALADPFPATLDGMVHAFADEADFVIVARVNDGEAALQAIRERAPDIIVLDLFLPKKDGLTLLSEMKREGLNTRPVLFTAAPPAEIVQAVQLGVHGVVTKEMPLKLLARCIREVHSGGQWLEKTFAAHAISYLLKREEGGLNMRSVLTPRQMMVARMASEGLPNKLIAKKLFISEGTAKLHLHRIYQKLRLRGRMELMNYVHSYGG